MKYYTPLGISADSNVGKLHGERHSCLKMQSVLTLPETFDTHVIFHAETDSVTSQQVHLLKPGLSGWAGRRPRAAEYETRKI